MQRKLLVKDTSCFKLKTESYYVNLEFILIISRLFLYGI